MHGFTTLALPVISAVVQVDNQSSHRVADRLGMRDTGPVTFNGMPHRRYELTREAALARDGAAGDGAD